LRFSLPKYPVLAGRAIVRAGRTNLFLHDRVLKIAVRGLPLARFFELCDGTREYREIRSKLALRKRAIRLDQLLAALTRAGAMIDASELSRTGLRFGENPSRMGGPANAPAASAPAPRAARRPGLRYRPAPRFRLRRLIEKRRSVRNFADRPVALESILALLWSANGGVPRGTRPAGEGPEFPRTVPSGGALYPLTLGLVNLRPVPELERGLYIAHFRPDGAVALEKLEAAEASQLPRAFIDPAPLEHAQGVIVVFGELARSAVRYRNRSVLLVLLEAGHAVQSALLCATELGLGSVEICGFFEQRLRDAFGAGEEQVPLSTIIFGRPAGRRPGPQPAPAPAKVSFDWIDATGVAYEPPFHLGKVQVSVGAREPVTTWGRSRDPLLAWRKAHAEAVERFACAQPAGLREARIGELRSMLDPRQLVAYSERQYAAPRFPYKPLSERRVYGWKDGRDLITGKRHAVLAECVYFRSALPPRLRAQAYTAASTSGVAAYPTWEGAVERAAAELLERDAFMRAWLLGESGAALRERSMPSQIAARIRRLRSIGVDVLVKLLREDPVHVFMIFAQHRQRHFTCVASGAAPRPEEALELALMEAEPVISARLGVDRPAGMRPSDVYMPADHGLLYAQRRYYRKADHLTLSSSPAIAMPSAGRRPRPPFDSLLGWLQRARRSLVWVDLSGKTAPLPGAPRVHVVRVLIPGMLPVTFGHGAEPLGMLGVDAARIPRVPHPFG
jgi:ribosomal protein S12 methylthiotransferase accessory factor